jgi:hypothetical protein
MQFVCATRHLQRPLIRTDVLEHASSNFSQWRAAGRILLHHINKTNSWRQNTNVHHRVQKSPQPVLVLSQLNPLLTSPANLSLRSTLIPSSHLRLGFLSGLFPSDVPTITVYIFLFYSMRATRPSRLILFDLMCLMIFRDYYKLWSSSLRNSFHSPVTSSVLRQHLVLKHRQSVLFP